MDESDALFFAAESGCVDTVKLQTKEKGPAALVIFVDTTCHENLQIMRDLRVSLDTDSVSTE